MVDNYGAGGDRAVKAQLFIAAFTSLAAALVVYFAGGPLPRSLALLAGFSAACFAGYCLATRFLAPGDRRRANSVMGLLAAVIISSSVHVTGGIVSPFVFMFFVVLVAESLYGMGETYTLTAILAGYLLVVFGEYSGLFLAANSWAAEVYSSLSATALIAGITAAYLVLTRLTSRLIMSNLRLRAEQESGDKEALLKKFSELNSTTQLGVLAHRIAHDLRGPIASISGYIELEMAKSKSPEDMAELRSVGETVDAMVQSLHGITRFGKPGGPSAEKIVLAGFIRDLLAITAFSPQAREVKFETLYPAGLAAATVASRADLQQAFFNIFKNSVEAVLGNPAGKTVTIDIKPSGPEILVLISDNGQGVPEETLGALFRKSVTTKEGGTGVGLLITRDLLVRNGGDIKLANSAGGGVVAEVSLRAA